VKMPYLADLLEYQPTSSLARSVKSVGWLESGYAFRIQEPQPTLLDAIWKYCSILVSPTRGLHVCSFCELAHNTFSRHGIRLVLGSAEIVVFDAKGNAYAAPNLVYHYILEHQYCPPDEFLQAIETGPSPGSQEYSDLLVRLGLVWRPNLPVADVPKRFEFVKTGNGVEVKEVSTMKGTVKDDTK